MAAIGSICLDAADDLNAGLALLLVKPPKAEVEFNHRGAALRASPKTPFVFARFAAATSHSEALIVGIDIIQSGLDMLSITGKADLATRDAAEEYIAWWFHDGRRTLTYVSTFTYSITIPPVTVTALDAAGNAILPTPPSSPKYHAGFRFYRLAQVSDDLFDAYRNMYLAFEALLSSRFPRVKGQKERDWLRTSLAAAATELNIASLVRSAGPEVVDSILNIIYSDARLPLFHAKEGEAFFVPMRVGSDRAVVESALALLTRLVSRMAETWFHVRRLGGWANLQYFAGHHETLFADAEFAFANEPMDHRPADGDVLSVSVDRRSKADFCVEFCGETRHHVRGTLDVGEIPGPKTVTAFYVMKDELALLWCSPETVLDLNGFTGLEVLLFVRGNNASQPKRLFSR